MSEEVTRRVQGLLRALRKETEQSESQQDHNARLTDQLQNYLELRGTQPLIDRLIHAGGDMINHYRHVYNPPQFAHALANTCDDKTEAEEISKAITRAQKAMYDVLIARNAFSEHREISRAQGEACIAACETLRRDLPCIERHLERAGEQTLPTLANAQARTKTYMPNFNAELAPLLGNPAFAKAILARSNETEPYEDVSLETPATIVALAGITQAKTTATALSMGASPNGKKPSRNGKPHPRSSK